MTLPMSLFPANTAVSSRVGSKTPRHSTRPTSSVMRSDQRSSDRSRLSKTALYPSKPAVSKASKALISLHSHRFPRISLSTSTHKPKR